MHAKEKCKKVQSMMPTEKWTLIEGSVSNSGMKSQLNARKWIHQYYLPYDTGLYKIEGIINKMINLL